MRQEDKTTAYSEFAGESGRCQFVAADFDGTTHLLCGIVDRHIRVRITAIGAESNEKEGHHEP